MEATQTASHPQDAAPPSFESVWASIQEFARETKEFSRETKEFSRETKERNERFDREMRESKEKFDREMKESKEEFDRRTKETDRQIKKVSKQMGDLHNRFGDLAEHLVAPGIRARFNELGYSFHLVDTKGAKIYGENGKIKAEIDILLQGDDTIMAVEVKTKPAVKDVEHHLIRMEILRDSFRKINDRRKIQGAIAGAIFGSEEKKAVIEAGLFVIEQSGDTMKIEIPDGFVPREF